MRCVKLALVHYIKAHLRTSLAPRVYLRIELLKHWLLSLLGSKVVYVCVRYASVYAAVRDINISEI